MNKGLLIVISGPSGVGKGTVLKSVFEKDNNLVYSISCTTRNPRPGETNGVEYHFITKQKFEENIAGGKMLEYATYCDNYYGTGAEYVEMQRQKGFDVILEIETQGALQVLKKAPDAVSIFIAPPSFEILEQRLSGRGTESADVVKSRIARAYDEISHMDEYTYVIVNDTVEKACDDVLTVINAERIKNKKIKII